MSNQNVFFIQKTLICSITFCLVEIDTTTDDFILTSTYHKVTVSHGDKVKITKIEPILAGRRNLYVKVHTDEDHVGLGECGAWGYQEPTAVTLKQLEKLLIGQNPLRIEHIWNALTRNMHFRGSIINAAISGIDIALWDLKARARRWNRILLPT